MQQIKRMFRSIVISSTAILAVLLVHAVNAKSRIDFVPYQQLTQLPQGFTEAPSLEVRMATDADIEQASETWLGTNKDMGKEAGVGALSIGMGLLSAPAMGAAAMVLGGAIILPTVAVVGIKKQHDLSVIQQTLENVDMADIVYKTLDNKLDAGHQNQSDNSQLQVIILAYGLTKKPQNYRDEVTLCLSLNAEIQLSNSGGVLYHDIVILEPFRRSKDIIAPVCASSGEFADNDGALLAQSITVYAYALARVVEYRLSLLSWK